MGQRIRTAVLLAVILVSATGCSVEHRVQLFASQPPKRWVCLDGLPVLAIQDVRCAEGVCGFTCAPGRWESTGRD